MHQTYTLRWTSALVLLALQVVAAVNNTCGSLLSYRHYLVQLEAAPTCFIDGCTTQTTPTSMSDICPEDRPCSELWKVLHDEYQQDWCSDCTHDVVCRTRGWPILNASAFCDITPNKWIFGSGGTCCTAGTQAFELAAWLGSMCNDSEWRIPFNHYDGSARLDWEEWILPWNWTVRVENTTTRTYPPRECPKTYFSILAVLGENIIFLLVGVAVTGLKLQYIKARGDEVPWVMAFHERCHFLVYFKFWNWHIYISNLHKGLPADEEDEDPTKLSDHQVHISIFISVVMTALQVGFNFLNAWRIQSTLGYQNVPIVYLAILFCCRPRLTWLICVLELIDDKTVQKWFNFKNRKWETKANYTLSTISFGSAISEIVLQAISIYIMILTTNTGRTRDFYLVNHLRPFWKGPAALAMYVGALMWMISCFVTLVVWAFVVFFGTKVARSSRAAARKYRTVKKKVKKKVVDTARSSGPLTKIFPSLRRLPSVSTGTSTERRTEYEVVPQDPEMVGTAGTRTRDPNAQGHAGERLPPVLSQPQDYERIGLVAEDQEMMFERMPLRSTPGSGSHAYERVEMSGANRFATSSPFPYGATARDSRSDTLVGSTNYDEGNNLLAFSEVPLPNVHDLGEVEGEKDVLSGENDVVEVRKTAKQEKEEKSKHRIILLAMGVGTFAFIAQWVFWGGFVYAASERFCPPSIFSTAGIWLAASLTGLGISFAYQ